MSTTATWQGEARLAFGDGVETRVAASLARNGGPEPWTGELVIQGVAAILPGDRVELTVGRSTRTAIVREAAIRGGAGHRTTTLRVEGDSPPPAALLER
ncbi:hypothetical protein [Tepidiforma thermophila]|uniref:Uncharacterized protein n=1 Tax=Tepidiforma thermophila (strain KCTC 52669 / CGMCC 1.13589 / G233) TaxID=2761530 RepID=A0A2A9HCS6_TEPT2|nr:hypothetical protein [Tepidiforma thermophila]PFG73113.1 hypothetical protein A9A59_0307 [Tepidiforma thermophila]